MESSCAVSDSFLPFISRSSVIVTSLLVSCCKQKMNVLPSLSYKRRCYFCVLPIAVFSARGHSCYRLCVACLKVSVGESYRRRFRSVLCSCDVFRTLITSLDC